MIGLRAGISAGVRGSFQAGAVFTGFGIMFGQSHPQGFADDSAAGSGNLTGGDGALKYRVPLAACSYNQTSGTAPTSPQTYNVAFGTTSLQPYAAGGQSNTSIVQALGRFMNKYLGLANPYMAVCAIGSTSIPAHWAPTSNFPASGEKLYAHLRDYGLARMAERGAKFEFLIHQIGETDSATQSRIDSMQADYTAFYAQLRSDWGIPNLPIFMGIINTQTSGGAGGLVEQYRQKQIAWVPTDINAVAFDGSNIPLEANPHYLMGGYNELGNLVGIALRDKFLPGRSLDLGGINGSPWYQGGSSCYTSQASPNTTRPRGWVEPKVGDIELLVLHSSGTAHSLTVNTAAGFTQIAQRDSILSTSHRMLTLYTRTIDQTMLDARVADEFDGVKRGFVATPAIDCGVANLNVATTHCIRGSSGITVTPATGANNAGSTTVSIGGFTTTKANCLALIVIASNQVNGIVSSISNAAFSNITLGREGAVNPGAGSINLSMYWATIPNQGVVGATTVTLGASSLIAGAIVVFDP